MVPKLREAIKTFVKNKHSFTVVELRRRLNLIYKNSNKFYDTVTLSEIKKEVILLFERGNIPGYCIKSKPMMGENGPYFRTEFLPEICTYQLNIIPIPNKPCKTIFYLDKKRKRQLRALAKELKCSQDILVRSLIIKSINTL